ncbi:hypothetical protein M501DRAFT_936985 [Patellaria atrata CBS 101060]|uniref:Uncharacterized protein n=1 Tax=Patellaria atrata CBS 101060 TaxID=1346257 RepID=A0A9P4VNM5_9PEZI|nr:hypothetical protein M501DRAFT_936985 [Patellaria atrata CBS 101060]
MPARHRFIFLLILSTSILLLILYSNHSDLPQSVQDESLNRHQPTLLLSQGPPTSPALQPTFHPGTPLPATHNFTITLVLGRTLEDDVSWTSELSTLPNLQLAIYTADDPSAPLHPPQNKGHEAMIYLTYIIDNYASLPDVTVFMHAHRQAWHNDELLDYDAIEMVKNLNPHRVQREGYMNLRCHWDPGCPAWIQPNAGPDEDKPEQDILKTVWSEIFGPRAPLPHTLAQPCCAQFAVSGERIRSVPLEQWVWYRSWLLKTSLSDYVAGRVWEYIWQFAFSGQSIHCPKMHICYCDGFGVCFGGEERFNAWFEQRYSLRKWEKELDFIHEMEETILEAKYRGESGEEITQLEKPLGGRKEELERLVDPLRKQLEEWRQDSIRRGRDPRLRAEECGKE